jgi:glycerol uptake facilitator-like aquaporin
MSRNLEVGFAYPTRHAPGLRRRAVFAEFVATVVLVLCILAVVTAISCGIARADGLDGVIGETPLAPAAFIALFLTVMGLIIAALSRSPARKSTTRG